MVFFMSVGIKTLKIVTALETLLAEKEIVTVLAHPTVFYYLYLTIEAFMDFRVILLRLKNCFHLMILSMSLRWVFKRGSLKITFLT